MPSKIFFRTAKLDRPECNSKEPEAFCITTNDRVAVSYSDVDFRHCRSAASRCALCFDCQVKSTSTGGKAHCSHLWWLHSRNTICEEIRWLMIFRQHFGLERLFGGDESLSTMINFTQISRLLSLYTPLKTALHARVKGVPGPVLVGF